VRLELLLERLLIFWCEYVGRVSRLLPAVIRTGAYYDDVGY
jgi:hypothetical protein